MKFHFFGPANAENTQNPAYLHKKYLSYFRFQNFIYMYISRF